MRLAVDIDGILSAWVPAAVEAINSLRPNRLPADFEPTAWDWSPDITAEELKAATDKMRTTPDCWYNLKPYTENVSALRSFLHRRPNTEVYYLTARWSSEENSALEQSTAWLKRQRLMSPRTSVIRVATKDEKRCVVEALDVDACIDDCAETWMDCQMSCASYLLSRPWNQTAAKKYLALNVSESLLVDSIEEFLRRATASAKGVVANA